MVQAFVDVAVQCAAWVVIPFVPWQSVKRSIVAAGRKDAASKDDKGWLLVRGFDTTDKLRMWVGRTESC